MGDGADGSVLAVADGEGIVDVDIGESGELFGELGRVFLFFFVEAEVFEDKDLSGLELFTLCLCSGADGLWVEQDLGWGLGGGLEELL